MGPVVAPQAQPYPSTAGFVRQLFEGTDLVAFQWLHPHWFVDVRDAAALHVAALVLEGLEGERVLGEPSRIRGQRLLRLWRSCILGAWLRSWRIRGRIWASRQGRDEEPLRGLEGRGWIGFEESVRANVRAFILSEVVVG
jgi:hypothetical protein